MLAPHTAPRVPCASCVSLLLQYVIFSAGGGSESLPLENRVTLGAEADTELEAQARSGVTGPALKLAAKLGFPHPLWGTNPAAPIGSKWDNKTVGGTISEALPTQIDKGDTSRILV